MTDVFFVESVGKSRIDFSLDIEVIIRYLPYPEKILLSELNSSGNLLTFS